MSRTVSGAQSSFAQSSFAQSSVAQSFAQSPVAEIAIAGAGPVAGIAALALAKAGFSVTLMARGWLTPMQTPTTWQSRVYALAPDVLSYLQSLDLDLSQHPRGQDYQHMEVWEKQGSAIAFHARDYGWSSLGRIIDHATLQSEIYARLQLQRGVRWIYQDAQRVVSDEHFATAHAGDQSLQASLVLDATGQHSEIRNHAGITTQDHDYRQHALVAVLQGAALHDHVTPNATERTAYQCFDKQAVTALLPLPDNQAVLVYSAPEPQARALFEVNDEALYAILGKLFAPTFELPWQATNDRQLVPLKRMLANDYLADRLVLIGDSAHTVHPMAGQGLNLGLRDVECLLRNLTTTTSLAFKNYPVLQGLLLRYQRERKSENALAAFGIEGLQRWFQIPSGPLALLRNLGLSSVSQISPIKRLFAEMATGKVAGWPGS